MAAPKYVGTRTFLGARGGTPVDTLAGELVFTGAPLDAGQTFRVGARHAPAAIREASRSLRPFHLGHGLDLARVGILDAGDAEVVPGRIERGFDAIREQVGAILERGGRPIVMGGDCSIAYPVLEAVAAAHGPVALLHFDAHTDTWDSYWGERFTHGTAVRRVIERGFIDPASSAQIGIRGSAYDPSDVQQSRDLGLLVVTGEDVHLSGPDAVAEQLVDRVGDRPVFVHFDIDCLDPAFAPGTGLPEVGGLSTFQASRILGRLAGARVIGGELTEVLPAYDPSGITGIAAANIMFEIAALAGSHGR